MIVACDAKNGKVVGFAEVDARPLGINKNIVSKNESSLREGASDDILRSYMYNLAVDKRWKRKGIASALVTVCEQIVSDMHDLCVEKRLYLRVRKSNRAAIALYESLGYREMLPEAIQLSREDINSGSLEDVKRTGPYTGTITEIAMDSAMINHSAALMGSFGEMSSYDKTDFK
ncbi:hypothetical protein ACHAW5_007215 [Stephanodiscus triporus]|uniref:N-acetyltransferase domain-containing protein n=1 Tax=Stephanodiscus triporus TaxID=2934178 RepID=A0ABD3MIT1_9STRA